MMEHKPNRHELMRDDLKAYLDGELPLLHRWLVRRHLASCEACRKEIEFMEKIGNELRAAAGEEALPSPLKERILEGAPPAPAKHQIEMPAQKRANRPSLKDMALIGSMLAVIAIMVVSQTGKKVQTVFNVANNSLTTTDGSEDNSPSSSWFGSSDSAADSAPRSGSIAVPPPPSRVSNQSNLKQLSPEFRNRMANSAAAVAEQRASDSITRHLDGAPMGAPMPAAKSRIGSNASAESAWPGNTDDLPPMLRRVHKEGRITVAVTQVEDASTEVISAIKGAGGYVATNNLSTGSDGARTATIEARVPVEEFDALLTQIGKKGTVKAKNVTGQDVTARYSDAQQANNVISSELGVREAQLQDALKRAEKKDRPGQISWQQRAEVRQLRIQASQARARLEIYRRLSDMSNVSVQLQEKKPVPGQAGFLDSVSQTGHEAAQTFTVAARIPVNCIIWILAYSPLWLPLLIGIRFLMKSQQKTS